MLLIEYVNTLLFEYNMNILKLRIKMALLARDQKAKVFV